MYARIHSFFSTMYTFIIARKEYANAFLMHIENISKNAASLIGENCIGEGEGVYLRINLPPLC